MSIKWFYRLAPLALIALALSLLLAAPAAAHDLNLGGSKWLIGQDRILFTIELGSALLPQMDGIETYGDDLGSLSGEQLQELADNIIQPYINERLSLAVNERSYPAAVERIEREGTLWKIWLKAGGIDFDRDLNQVSIDYRLLFEETKNDHVNVAMIYFSDAGDAEAQQVFDTTQPDLQYSLDAGHTAWELSADSKSSVWSNLFSFLALGVEHILLGFDHIAFLIALIVIGLSWREGIKVISAFTLAHSITLLLAALQVISLNARFVEIVIALSICYIALENLLAKKVNYRWLAAFAFGLIHGFGFASALQELIAGKTNLVLSVVSFNAGVEIGQLLIFASLLPLLHLLRRRIANRMITAGASTAILILGLIWLAERAFDLRLLAF